MTIYQLSVRSFVEFLLKSGNIDNRQRTSSDEAMQQGSRIHRQIQSERGPGYIAEAALSYVHDTGRYQIVLEGRADGILPLSNVEAGVEDLYEPVDLDAWIQAAPPKTEGAAAGRPALQGEAEEEAVQLTLEDLLKGLQNQTQAAAGNHPENLASNIEGNPTGNEHIQADDAGAHGWSPALRVSPETVYEGEVDSTLDGIDWSITPIIEEIKTTYSSVFWLKNPKPVHLAQAKCYAWFYCLQTHCENVRVLMTYVNIATGETRYFYEKCTAVGLKEWFDRLMNAYIPWMDYQYDWNIIRRESILQNEFPYDYRTGQRELCAEVTKTIEEEKKLFLEAPTGSGKTLATIFPSVDAIGRGKAGRLFYLTSRTTLRAMAEDAFTLMRAHSGLRFKTVTLTAKEKICFTETHECNPEACPFAKGHYDRVNTALFDLIHHEEVFSREIVERYAMKHTVCPFELSLDASLFSDGIIGDYNYLFDPFVYLRRFFGEGHPADSIFLVDEAHNLVDRGRAMYSTELAQRDLRILRKKIEHDVLLDPVVYHLDQVEKELLDLDSGVSDTTQTAGGFVRDNLLEKGADIWRWANQQERLILIDDVESLYDAILKLNKAIAAYLDLPRKKLRFRDEVLELYLILFRFCTLYERMDSRYVMYGTNETAEKKEESGKRVSGRGFVLHLYCIDPSKDLAAQMENGVATVLFSATLLPLDYYKRLLGGTQQDSEIYAASSFDPNRCLRLILNDVTSKYKKRTPEMYERIAHAIRAVVDGKRGNYMVFFPSYDFMEKVYEYLKQDQEVTEIGVDCPALRLSDEALEEDAVPPNVLLLKQFKEMSEKQRTAFLSHFSKSSNAGAEDTTLIGLCVMGGIFSEGIDLSGESLIGVAVVGTGRPQITIERKLIQDWFDLNADENEKNGFDMASTYPGICRVLQAAGRVIRTSTDIGVVALLDSDFTGRRYSGLLPQDWQSKKICRTDKVSSILDEFWKIRDRGL